MSKNLSKKEEKLLLKEKIKKEKEKEAKKVAKAKAKAKHLEQKIRYRDKKAEEIEEIKEEGKAFVINSALKFVPGGKYIATGMNTISTVVEHKDKIVGILNFHKPEIDKHGRKIKKEKK